MFKKLLLILSVVSVLKSMDVYDQNSDQVKTCTEFSIYCKNISQRNDLKSSLKNVAWLQEFFEPCVDVSDEKKGFGICYYRKTLCFSFEQIFESLWPILRKLNLGPKSFWSKSVC